MHRKKMSTIIYIQLTVIKKNYNISDKKKYKKNNVNFMNIYKNRINIFKILKREIKLKRKKYFFKYLLKYTLKLLKPNECGFYFPTPYVYKTTVTA